MSIRPYLICLAVWLAGCLNPGQAGTLETANVMAPLKVDNWQAFEQQLATVKGYGVDAVSVDVWWGSVEGTADNKFVWDYYDTIFAKIRAHGLKIVPILSFHQCGGNVGDDCNIPLPAWLWQKYAGQMFKSIELDANDLKFKSEQGHFSGEFIQPWADELVVGEYTDFVAAFKTQFAGYEQDFIEVNVSLGPSGELRYPSYNAHDSGTGYPTRGALQAYSRLAVSDFRSKMLAKYQTLERINSVWGTRLTDVSEIQPPTDANQFFAGASYWNTPYGKDFVDWYNQALVDHGAVLLRSVGTALGRAFAGAKLGYKIPGVHWAMTHPSYPRAAEVAAGLIQTSVNMNADATGHGYDNIVGLAARLSSSLARSVVLHFTCLEMDDSPGASAYSQAKSLVFWVAQAAARIGVSVKGENALSGGATSDHGWDNIENAFRYASYSGLTVLRIGEVASGGTGQTRYAEFIGKFLGGGDTWYFRGTPNHWSTTPMTRINGSDVFTVTIPFAKEEPQPRFKIDHQGNWKESYPSEDFMVPTDCVRYEIRFDRASKNIQTIRIGHITSGVCSTSSSSIPPASGKPGVG